MNVEVLIQKNAAHPIPHQVLLSILHEYKRPNDKIHSLIQEQKLIPLKKGLYVWNSDVLPENFSIANTLYAPSYVSVESALSFYGLIPERVFSVSSMKCFVLEDLFAGKIHALLFRKWGNNIKGRDWYDLEWYIRKGVSLNLQHFLLRAIDSGDWVKETISQTEFTRLLRSRIESLNFEVAKKDVERFIPNPRVLDIWSKQYFLDLTKELKIKE
ncbi:nucleotidyl transferase AbiEii/AbiGii toxin family protein [Chryseobacterium sp. A321]